MTTRTAPRRRRPLLLRRLGPDRGSTTVEMVGYFAVMLAALLVGVQAAAWGLAELSCRYAANHATRGHDRWRCLFFLDHLDFLRNLRRRTELAVLDVALDRLHHPDGGRRWRRWRWRRRRRCHQECHQLLLRQRLGED